MALQTNTFTSTCSGTYGAYYTLTLTITENSTSIINGKPYSNVTVSLTRTRYNSSYTNYGWDNPTKIEINGSTWATATPVSAHNVYATQTLIEHTGDIEHNSDGTMTINVTGSFTSNSSSLRGGTVSGSMTLTTVPMATDCPTFSGTVGSQVRITLNSASSSFNHKLYYYLNDTETLIANFSSGSTTPYVNYTIPDSLANYITSSNSLTLQLRLRTYSGSSQVGNTTWDNATISLSQADITPEISVTSLVDTNPDTIALTGGDSSKLITFKSEITATVNYKVGKGATLNYIFAEYQYDPYNYAILASASSGNILEDISTPPENYFGLSWGYDGIKDLIFEVMDSRYKSATTKINVANDSRFILYSPIYSDKDNTVVTLSRPTVLAQTMYLNFSFEWWRGTFPNGTANTLNVSWRVKRRQDSDNSWSAWQPISSGFNTYNQAKYNTQTYPNRASTLTGTIIFNPETGAEISRQYTPIAIENPLDINGDGNADITWDYLTNYDFQIRAEDLLDERTINAQINASVSIYDAFQTANGNKYFNVNGDILVKNKPLRKYINSYATAYTGDTMEIPANTTLQAVLTDMVTNSDFTLRNGRIYIPQGVSTIEFGGVYCGHGSMTAYITVYNSEDTIVAEPNILTQPAGNGYFRASLSSYIYRIDSSQEHSIALYVRGYDMNAHLNDGFGGTATSIWVKILE